LQLSGWLATISVAHHRMSQDPLHPGRIFKSDVSSIWVKTWAQVLEDNRSRLQFFQERLEYEADKGAALRKLQDQHAKLLQGVLDDPPKETADNIDELVVGELVDEIEPDSNEDEFDVEDEETVVGP
jgi:hypothetical protein